ncbi:MAG: D-2-hydroxyacid dehydrogenase [Kiritimatiellae bacterium]|nr:D-2-hydroxyacid dehydrogenase [Kiritimatiellia bacterium]
MNFKKMTVFQESAIPYFTIREEHIHRLRGIYPGKIVAWCRNIDDFLRELPDSEVALTWEFRQEWFDHAPALRRIATPAAGRDFFPIVPPPTVAVRHGTFHGPLMGETLLGMMLAFNRGILSAHRYQLEDRLWPRAELDSSRLICGTHAVILGFGAIGQTFGRMLKPFGIRITGVKRKPMPSAPDWFTADDRVLTADRLDEALPEADHLIVILPNDTGTDRIVNADRIARLPRHAVIYNLGRGNSIDEAALAEALQTGRIRGACLDVFAQEPLTAASPLAKNLPGLFRMPHASAFSYVYMDRFIDEVVQWLKD